MNAAIFETNSDTTTQSVHRARRKVLAGIAAYPSYELFGNDAFAADVRIAYSRAGRFDLFSGMGHGGDDCFEGQGGTGVFDTNSYNSTNAALKGSIVHLYSCNCAKQLGPFLIRHGAKAFIGYRSPVIVPNTQSVVDEFVKIPAVIDQSILNGDSAYLTKVKADNAFSTIETRLLSATSDATPRDIASLRMNHRSMVGPWAAHNGEYGSY